MRKKKILVALLVALVLAGSFVAVKEVHAALYGLRSFYCSIVDENGEKVSSACTMTVYTAGGHTGATVYSDNQKTAIGTTLTSVTTGDFQFWGSATSYDIVVTLDSGDGSDVKLGVTPPNSRFIIPTGGLSSIIRTKAVTVGHPGETTTDYAYTSAANTTEQTLSIGAIVPPYARVLDVTVICTETITSSTWQADVGVSAGGAELLETAAACDAAAEVLGGDAAGAFNLAVSASAQTVYLNGTPGANWSGMLAGEWLVTVTYLDIGSLY